jgi:putative chitinase
MSKNFSLSEATASNTADDYRIVNYPSNDQTMANISWAQEGMEKVRTILGDKPIKVNSWLRVEELEKIVAKKDYEGWCARHKKAKDAASWKEYFTRKGHPRGFCIDFTCTAFGTPAQVVAKLQSSSLKYDQLICEGTWVHVSFDPAMKQQTMVATFAADGTPSYSKA